MPEVRGSRLLQPKNCLAQPGQTMISVWKGKGSQQTFRPVAGFPDRNTKAQLLSWHGRAEMGWLAAQAAGKPVLTAEPCGLVDDEDPAQKIKK